MVNPRAVVWASVMWVAIFATSIFQCHAQSWTWATAAAGNGNAAGNGIVTDANGNIYVTGAFDGIADFGNGITLTSLGQYDIFVAKYYPGGGIAWAIRAGMSQEDIGQEITVDAAGDVYVTGSFTDSIRFATASGSVVALGQGMSDLFLVKLDPLTGKALWLSAAGGSGDDAGMSLTVAGASIYVAGYFEFNCTVGAINITGFGGRDALVASFDQIGATWNWAINGGTAAEDEATSICLLGNDVYATGRFSGATFSFGATTCIGLGGVDGFVSRITSTGVVVWSSYISSTTANDAPTAIASDGSNIYVTGTMSSPGTISCYGSPVMNATSAGALTDFWVARFGPVTGNCAWVRAEGGNGNDQATSIVSSGPTTVTVTGSFENNIILAGIPLAGPGAEMFIESFQSPTGMPVAAISTGGPGLTNPNDVTFDANCGLLFTGRYSLTQTFGSLPVLTATGATDAFNARLSVAPIVMPVQTPASTQVCSGGSVGISLSGTISSVTWDVSTDNGATWTVLTGITTQTINVTPLASAWYRSHYTGQCIGGMDTTVVTVGGLQPTLIVGLPDTTCLSFAASNFSLSPASPLGLITTSTPGFTNLGSGNMSFDPTTAGTGMHFIQYDYTDLVNCTTTATDSIYVQAPPTLSFTGLDSSYCENDTSSYLLTGNMAPSGTWASACGCLTDLGNGTAIIQPSAAPSGLPFWVRYSEGVACPGQTMALTVVDSARDMDMLGMPSSVCTSDSPFILISNSLDAVFSPTSPGFVDNGNGTVTFDPGYFTPGPHTFYVDGPPGVCANMDSVTVVIDSLPIVTLTVTDSILCELDSPLLLSGNHGSAYVFAPPQSYITDQGNGTALFNPAMAPLGTWLPITYHYQAPTGCEATATAALIVHPQPTASITNLLPGYCENAPADTISGNYGTMDTFSGGPWLTWIGNGQAIVDPSFANPDSLHLVVYAVTDTNGCAAADSQWVAIHRSPDADAGADQDTCLGNGVTLGTAATLGTTYHWQEIGSAWASALPQPMVTPTATTLYTLEIADSNGCRDLDSVQVTIILIETADAGPDATLCFGDSVVLGGSISPNANVSWSDSLGYSTSIHFPMVSPLQSESYLLVLTDGTGQCSDSDRVFVTITQPAPTADAGPDQNVAVGASILMAGSDPYPASGLWSCIEGSIALNDPSAPNAMIAEAPLGTWTLVWTVTNGPCIATADSMRIFVDEMVLPTGFSPNGDGVNDLLVFSSLPPSSSAKLQVFNRWGELIWDEDTYQNDWGGTNRNGQPLVDDTYFYVLQLPDGKTMNRYLVLKR